MTTIAVSADFADIISLFAKRAFSRSVEIDAVFDHNLSSTGGVKYGSNLTAVLIVVGQVITVLTNCTCGLAVLNEAIGQHFRNANIIQRGVVQIHIVSSLTAGSLGQIEASLTLRTFVLVVVNVAVLVNRIDGNTLL